MMEKDREAESLPAGIVTMMLTGYLKTIENQYKMLTAAIIGWTLTIIAFTAYILINRW